jgi:hypothetical protein
MVEYIAYIDVAGDDGFHKLATADKGGQSRWLILGCCLVTSDVDRLLPGFRDSILSRFPQRKTRELHFRNLNHAQKVVTSQMVGGFPIEGALTLSNKATIPGSKWAVTFAQKGYLYNYLLRWLLERVTDHCHAQNRGCSLRLVFSRRSGTDYQKMVRYLELMRDGREVMRQVRKINWNVLNIADIRVENHSKWAGLQLADCLNSAFFSAIEPNLYGNYETAYAENLRTRLIVSGGTALNAGLTFVPSVTASKLDERQEAFVLTFRKR